MTAFIVLAIVAGIIGVIGSIVPGLPGPPISWIGILFAYLAKGTNGAGDPMSTTLLVVLFVVMVAVTVLDYVVPAQFTKLTGGSKAAATGAILGLFAGMFLTPIGMIAGSLLGAFLAELMVEGKDFTASVKASLGAFLGFLFGTGLKLIASGVMMYYIVVYCW